MDDRRSSATGLPLPPSPLIGRAGDVSRARAMLGATRLVTLVGTGGTGKTRLAMELALDLRAEFPDGAVFVDLAPLTDAAQVLPAIARALGLRDAGIQPLELTLRQHLRDRQVLLVLDNVEHVLAAAAGVADLLAQCPDVRVLATSRAALQAPGEHLLAVEPLPVPDLLALPGPTDLIGTSSVALFVARVSAAQPDFALSEANARTATSRRACGRAPCSTGSGTSGATWAMGATTSNGCSPCRRPPSIPGRGRRRWTPSACSCCGRTSTRPPGSHWRRVPPSPSSSVTPSGWPGPPRRS